LSNGRSSLSKDSSARFGTRLISCTSDEADNFRF
jgi:hypothetical protein